VCWSYRYKHYDHTHPGIDILFDAHTHADVTSSILQLLGMAFSMTLYQQIHRAGKKYDA